MAKRGVFEAVFKAYLDGKLPASMGAPPEIVAAFDRIIADPVKAHTLLMEALKEDIRHGAAPPKAPRRKMRRGIGSY